MLKVMKPIEIRSCDVKKQMNIWSFVAAIMCILLFFIAAFFNEAPRIIFGVHFLVIVLCLTVCTFFFGLFGFSGVDNWKGWLRSIATILITVGLAVFLGFILLIGKLLG